MSLPVNVTSLFNRRNIGSDRVEFREEWDPTEVLHSLCAFANDMEEVGGGYVLIGVAETEDGRPEVVGIGPERASEIER